MILKSINTELALADLESCEKAILRLQKRAKGGDKEAKFELSVMEKMLCRCLKMPECYVLSAWMRKSCKRLKVITF